MPSRNVLPNVIEQFESLNVRGDRLAVGEGYGQEFRDKRYSIFHNDGGKNNHFQGVQRIGNFLLVSGSFPYHAPRADLFVFQLGSRASDPGPWGSNMMRDDKPASTDRLVNYFSIDTTDTTYWHPGGFGLLDDVAVLPLEDSNKRSKIAFVDVSDPANPTRKAGHDIDRPDYKAGALAVTTCPDGSVLLMVWSDSDKDLPNGDKAPFHLDLYRSNTVGDLSTFVMVAQYFPSSGDDFHRKFQCLDLIWEQADDGAERLYVIGFENSSDAQPNPMDAGRNLACLFEIDYDELPSSPDSSGAPVQLNADVFELRSQPLEFQTSGNWCNMDAGSCAYVDSNQHLIIYSAYHFLAPLKGQSGDLGLRCLEFRATDFLPFITRIEDGWVDLYEQEAMDGRRLALLGPWDSSIDNTSKIYVDGRKPFDRTLSIRYQLPIGNAFVLYTEEDYRGSAALVLTGDGQVREVNVSAVAFGGDFASCRLQLESVARGLPEAIIV